MCSAYYLDPDRVTGAVADALREIRLQGLNHHDGTTLLPTDHAPVITAHGVRIMPWGFTLTDRRSPVINARLETASRKPLFAPHLSHHRCLLPASGYYEWNATRARYDIAGDAPLYLAGIYRLEDDRADHFCILTRDADEALSFIHDRMPVVLTADEARRYLTGALSPEDLLTRPSPRLTARTDAVQLSMF